MINPRILEHSEETKSGEEGCFSVPDTYGEVERYCKIKVQFFDEKGDAQSLILKDFNARIVQHEIDHLDGILFTDKLEAN
jgi:peptide deformylase